MFFRNKQTGKYSYLQIVENYREHKKVKQRILFTVGRLDILQKSGQIDALIRSGLRFCEKLKAIEEVEKMDTAGECNTIRIGPNLLFERLWKTTGIEHAIKGCLESRRYDFDVERAIFMTCLHRLFEPGSDRAADKWRRDVYIPNTESLELQHLYRTMAFLGEPLQKKLEEDALPFSFRCMKDRIEEALFAHRRDLFSGLSLVFFDTTSLYFEGDGGMELGKRGHSKDHRPDRPQVVAGMILDEQGRPLSSELWPGNTSDVKSLLPIAGRLRKRFGIEQVCLVADRGMISAATLTELENPKSGWPYILGARMRAQKEVSETILARAGAYREVTPERVLSKDPSPLKVKEVRHEGRRYIVCLNEEQRRKDAHDRQQIIDALREQLKRGEKPLIGNKGFRKYLKTKSPNNLCLDEAKIKREARYDGKWVLRTNLDLPAEQIALRYKELWQVETMFRSMKTLLKTRPIYHKCDETIRGHIFCSFLALVLRKELEDALALRGQKYEWADIKRDINELQEIEATLRGRHYKLRSKLKGCAYNVLNAVGIKIPPSLTEI